MFAKIKLIKENKSTSNHTNILHQERTPRVSKKPCNFITFTRSERFVLKDPLVSFKPIFSKQGFNRNWPNQIWLRLEWITKHPLDMKYREQLLATSHRNSSQKCHQIFKRIHKRPAYNFWSPKLFDEKSIHFHFSCFLN